MKVVIRRESLERFWPLLESSAGRLGKSATVKLAAHTGDADGGLLVLTAAGDDIGVRAVTSAEVARTGEVLLPPGRFRQVLRETPAATFGIEQEASSIAVTAPGARFDFPVLAVGYTRDVPAPMDGPCCEVDSERLTEAIDLACRTADQKAHNRRWTLNAVLLQPCSEGLRVVATDGKRMVVLIVPAVTHPDCSGSYLLALQVGDVIGRCRMTGTVRITFDGPACTLDYGAVSLRCQFLQGTFAPWREILPKSKPAVTASLGANDFLLMLRQASAGAEKESRAADLSFTADRIRCEMQDEDGRDCSEVEGPGPLDYRGQPFRVRLDINLVMGWLRTVVRSDAQAAITMEMHDPLKKPLVFRWTDQSLYLVMPMDTQE